MSDANASDLFVEPPHIEWRDGRPYALARMSRDYAETLTRLALDSEEAVKALPPDPAWESVADSNTTTSRYSRYSSFLLHPATLPLYFAVHATYRHLLCELEQRPQARFIQCWYNIHRAGEALFRHKHTYPFIGAFSANAEGSITHYGNTRRATEWDVPIQHVNGQLLVTIGKDHYHGTSVWTDPDTPRVTFAFDIVDAGQWSARHVMLPFDR